MKKVMNEISMLVVLLVAGMNMAACSSDTDSERVLQSAELETSLSQTYTMIVSAQKSSETSRGVLTDGGSTIVTEWSVGDEVSVYNETKTVALTGTLTAQSAGSNTTLSGELTGTVDVGDVLTLTYKSDNYDLQDGTLEGIAANCDYATSTITVTAVSSNSIITDNATFTNHQAIVKFTLKNSDASSTLNATKLLIDADGNISTVVPASATNELYVAIPGISSKNIMLAAVVGGTVYGLTKSGVTFVNGDYYRVTSKLIAPVTLTSVTAADLGKVIGANGNVYPNTLCATAAETTASGIIAYISNGGTVDASSNIYKGLAIGLTDANEGSQCTWYPSIETNVPDCLNATTRLDYAIADKNGIAYTESLVNSNGSGITSYCLGHTHAAAIAASNYSTSRPSGCSAWFLPSIGQWNLIVQGLATKKAGYTITTELSQTENELFKATNLNSVITDAGGTGLRSHYYWSSTEAQSYDAWYMLFYPGRCSYYYKTDLQYVRAVFAF